MARDSQLMVSLVATRQRIPWGYVRRFLIAALIAALLLIALSLMLPNHAHAQAALATFGA